MLVLIFVAVVRAFLAVFVFPVPGVGMAGFRALCVRHPFALPIVLLADLLVALGGLMIVPGLRGIADRGRRRDRFSRQEGVHRFLEGVGMGVHDPRWAPGGLRVIVQDRSFQGLQRGEKPRVRAHPDRSARSAPAGY